MQCAQQADIPFAVIPTGKLRRYFSWKNVTDGLRVPAGVFAAMRILRKFKPDVVFSKGGYVAVPVVWAAWLLRIPIVIHESDLLPGLATRITMRMAKVVCLGWKETMAVLTQKTQKRAVVTGHPIRSEIVHGDQKRGLALAGFRDTEPVVLVMGGSLGAQRINAVLRAALQRLMPHCQVVHLCGRGNLVPEKAEWQYRYKQIEYVNHELPHLYAAADIVVSRAGSGSIAELVSVGKPVIFIPLSRQASRGDQIANAEALARNDAAVIVHDDRTLNGEKLADAVIALLRNPRRCAALTTRMHTKLHLHAAEKVWKILQQFSI